MQALVECTSPVGLPPDQPDISIDLLRQHGTSKECRKSIAQKNSQRLVVFISQISFQQLLSLRYSAFLIGAGQDFFWDLRW